MHFKWKLLIGMLSIIGLLYTGSVYLLADTAVVKYDHLNVRSGPGTDYDILGQINSGDTYEIDVIEDGWTGIRFNGQKGWVSSQYLTVKTDKDNDKEQANMDKPSRQSITIKQNNLHLRSGPSTQEAISGYVHDGDQLEVKKENQQWMKVVGKDQSGYLFKDLLHESRDHKQMPLQNKTIVIDAGHGGRDVGAIGTSGTYEKRFTLNTSQALQKELQHLGAKVITTRSKDTFESLLSRSALANNTDAAVFISLHYNSMPDFPTATGVETYYYHDQDKPLAGYIQQDVARVSEAKDRGITEQNFSVIRQTFKPSVLIELGYLSNAEDEQRFKKHSYQKKLAKGLASGVQRYLQQAE